MYTELCSHCGAEVQVGSCAYAGSQQPEVSYFLRYPIFGNGGTICVSPDGEAPAEIAGTTRVYEISVEEMEQAGIEVPEIATQISEEKLVSLRRVARNEYWM